MPLYFLDPYGCVKNQVDAENMMALLEGSGWAAAESPAEADLIIVNSCGFIESAKRQSINAVLSWRKTYPGKKILLAGCLAQRYAADLALSLPEADALFGNADLGGIAAAAAALLENPAPGAPRPGAVPARPGSRPLLSLPGSAYVKISEGCDNRCSFCSIPLIRGGLRSREAGELLAECREFLGRGIRELCLIGQDTGSYGRDREGGPALPGLLEAIAALPGDFWLRILYIHPDSFPLPILDTMKRDSRFLPYFDIPFQHGSDRILAAMNRRGRAETYLDLIARIREALPDAVIRSTFLLGFPGETGEDFERLLDFQEKARLDWAGCFAYSREEDTPAYAMKGRVAKKAARERKRIVEERQVPISGEQMERFVGRRMDVLVEEALDPEGGLYLGRLYCQAPEVDGVTVINAGRPLEPGSLVRGKVTGRAGFDLEILIE
ncbi:MAG: 30S ribosomal protein S12 methylthiotransferase RimO [Treponema sp.]|nr:30S ribosomal protein S12 methylthiotransferase RimO [Treponema sp.]